ERARDRVGIEPARMVYALPEPRDPGPAVDRGQRTGRPVDVGDEEPHRVRPDVDGRDSHAAPTSGPSACADRDRHRPGRRISAWPLMRLRPPALPRARIAIDTDRAEGSPPGPSCGSALRLAPHTVPSASCAATQKPTGSSPPARYQA